MEYALAYWMERIAYSTWRAIIIGAGMYYLSRHILALREPETVFDVGIQLAWYQTFGLHAGTVIGLILMLLGFIGVVVRVLTPFMDFRGR